MMHDDGWWSSGEEDVVRFATSFPGETFRAIKFCKWHKLEAPKLRGIEFRAEKDGRRKKETEEEEEPKESWIHARRVYRWSVCSSQSDGRGAEESRTLAEKHN